MPSQLRELTLAGLGALLEQMPRVAPLVLKPLPRWMADALLLREPGVKPVAKRRGGNV